MTHTADPYDAAVHAALTDLGGLPSSHQDNPALAVLRSAELMTALTERAAAKMRDAAKDLEQAAAVAREADAPAWFAGQLEAYTIPILRRFADPDPDAAQPGNLPRLLGNL